MRLNARYVPGSVLSTGDTVPKRLQVSGRPEESSQKRDRTGMRGAKEPLWRSGGSAGGGVVQAEGTASTKVTSERGCSGASQGGRAGARPRGASGPTRTRWPLEASGLAGRRCGPGFHPSLHRTHVQLPSSSFIRVRPITTTSVLSHTFQF